MEPGPGIRQSAYEPGLWFVSAEPGTTLQDHGTQWQIGTRYSLVKVLGYGSFSAVCLAVDNTTGEKVALKRVADVLQSPDHTKRVLREICILRRLRHPNVIGIRDAFVRPSATGQCRLIRGRLVNLSVDVYIAMELADGGDLFHLRGQMSSNEVKSLMWQLIVTVKYLHSMHVWHRDIKSQNVFLAWENGERVIKIGDFGSARSATPEGYQWAEQSAPNKAGTVELTGRPAGLPMLHVADSYQAMNEAMQPEDLYVQHEREGSGEGRSGSRPGYKAPLTRVVATPCYRAPEVVMSRGGYTAAIDMWSLGCIFGELLQRIAHVGSAATPNLQVAPLFAIHGLPKTPDEGESFVGGPGNEMTRNELQALFKVIGTPCWADVAAVQEPHWRRYLHHLPGRAPTLYRRFSAAGEAAVDLLCRLLAFDPTRRCSPDEALAHEYFADIVAAAETGNHDEASASPIVARAKHGVGLESGNGMAAGAANVGGINGAFEALQDPSAVAITEPATPLSALQPYSVAAAGVQGARQGQVAAAQAGAAALQQAPGTAAGAAAVAAASAAIAAACEPTASSLAAPFASRLHVASPSHIEERPNSPFAAAAPPAGEEAGASGGGADVRMREAGAGNEGRSARHYWEESDPGRALSMLEDELSMVTGCYCTTTPQDEGCQKMRRMLEEECEAIRAQSQARPAAAATPGAGDVAGGTAGDTSGSGKKRARVPNTGGGDQSIAASLLKHREAGLQEDTAATAGGVDPERYGRERLSNVADTWQGRELDPSRILYPQRHGEWFKQPPTQGPAPGPAWGVTTLPPGMDESQMDPQLLAIMRAQHGR